MPSSTLGIEFFEEDLTQVSVTPIGTDGLIIGHFERGPAMIPTKISSPEQLVNVFGAQNTLSKIAADNLLKNSERLTVVRLIGLANADYPNAFPGWGLGNSNANPAMPAVGGIKAITISGTINENPTFATNSVGNPKGHIMAAIALWDDDNACFFNTASLAAGHVTVITTGGALTGWISASNAATSAQIANGVYDMQIPTGSVDTVGKSAKISFDRSSDKYIGKVLNTDLTRLREHGHALVLANDYVHGHLVVDTFHDAANAWHIQAQLLSGSNRFDESSINAATPVLHSQIIGGVGHASLPFTNNPGGETYPLFKFQARTSGASGNGVRVRVSNIKKSSEPGYDYGKFDVVVLNKGGAQLERFTELTVDPDSDRFVSKVIGDKRYTFDNSDQQLSVTGDYEGSSEHIIVVLSSNSDQTLLSHPGTYAPKTSLPWGFEAYSAWGNLMNVVGATVVPDQGTVIDGKAKTPLVQRQFVNNSWTAARAWGVRSTRQGTDNSATESKIANVTDEALWNKWQYLGSTPASLKKDNTGTVVRTITAAFGGVNPYFSMHHLTGANALTTSVRLSIIDQKALTYNTTGTRAPLLSFDSVEGTSVAQFELVCAGGHDGWHPNLFVNQADPTELVGAGTGLPTYTSTNRFMSYSSAAPDNNIHVAAYRTALAIIESEGDTPEILLTPGCRADNVVQAGLDVCAKKGDMFYVIDFGGKNETPSTLQTDRKNTLNYNSSYGALYSRWVRVRLGKGSTAFVPPSVVMAGVLAQNDRLKFPWYAPAGTTRGSLREFNVLAVDRSTKKSDQEALNDEQINVIVKNKGDFVVWGNTTTQQTLSALQQISIRRMAITAKRQIGNVVQELIFEPNNPTLWTRFEQKVTPFLDFIKRENGLEAFKVVVDEKTNTPLKQAQGILVGKILIKPTRSVKQIEIPFTITDNNVAFADA